jgi:hypothetical protein
MACDLKAQRFRFVQTANMSFARLQPHAEGSDTGQHVNARLGRGSGEHEYDSGH